MNEGGRIVEDIARLIALFVPHAPDPASLEQLSGFVKDRVRWTKAHGLHGQVRSKTAAAEKHGDIVRAAQYWFEEACAKTLYNLSQASAPFDADSPYWVVPRALAFARALGLEAALVVAIVDPNANGTAG